MVLTFIGATHRLHMAPLRPGLLLGLRNEFTVFLVPNIRDRVYVTVHHIVPDIRFYALALVYLPTLSITLYFRTSF